MTSVVVFAHNEETTIGTCLRSIQEAGLGPHDEVHVLVNGSTDGTLAAAKALAAVDARLRVHVIRLGDKCNAWNFYVHRLADPGQAMHVFVDGDVTVLPGSFAALARALDASEALAASATPRDGRTAPAWRSRILREHGLAGNLYALRDSTLRRFRDEGIRLPVGAIGDDPILLWLLRRDLRPQEAPRKERIQPSSEAGFSYRSFPFASLGGLIALARRQRRYALRDFQVRLLTEHLERGGRIPEFIGELYPGASVLTQLRAPFGFRPFRLRKLLFLSTWLGTRGRRRAVSPADMVGAAVDRG